MTKDKMKSIDFGDDIHIVGNRIKEMRERKGWSQEKLAELVGLSGNTIHRIETGQTVAKLDTFLAIADALGVSPNELVPERFWKTKNQEGSMGARICEKLSCLSDAEQAVVYSAMMNLIEGMLSLKKTA